MMCIHLLILSACPLWQARDFPFTMGCGGSRPAVETTGKESTATRKTRKQSVFLPSVPEVPVTVGSAVQFQPPPNTKIIFIFGTF